ncbi:MAG: hypothetical protein GY898_22500 [Proteobacteria bacterium]|nr:hypothetical protein [Pseudomonadota bacterium]
MSRLPLLLLLLIGCAPKAPVPPPEFTDPQRTPTGDPVLEAKIVDAHRLASMSDTDLIDLEKRARGEYATDTDISDFVGALIGRSDNGKALQFLHERAIRAADDQGKMADSLGFAMGQLRWATCERMARDYLTRRHISGAFLVRALCLERSGDHAAAVENVLAAAEVTIIEPEWIAKVIELMEQRSSAGLMPPGDQRVYDDLMLTAKQMDPLDRLFVHHLMGIWPEVPIGTVKPGGLTGNDVRLVVESRARGYRHCFELANADLRGNNRAAGRAVIEFEIGSLGQPAGPHAVLEDWRGHPAGPQIIECIGNQMLRLRFPRPRYGLPQVAQHEFAFRPN